MSNFFFQNKKRKISEAEPAEADISIQNGSMQENGNNLDDTSGEPKKKKKKKNKDKNGE